MTRITTPIVIFGFNRHNNIITLRAAMANLTFNKVYFIIDGPRQSRSQELSEVEKTISEMRAFENIAEIIFIKSDVNLGCKRRILSGLEKVFSNESEAIVLEDDCIPVPEFFKYCEDALQIYAEDTSVAMISGSNLLCDKFPQKNSVGKSIFINCWGWAGWRDKTWGLIDKGSYLADIKSKLRHSESFNSLPLLERTYWREILKHAISSNSVWDFYLQLGLFQAGKYSLYPPHNLIDNIGFDDAATHTKYGIPKFVRNNSAKNKIINFKKNYEDESRSDLDVARDKLISKTLYKFSIIGLMRLKLGNIFRFIGY